ncbi:MAG: hypothetical protein HOO99_17645 [Hyphomicrobiaceae bacterium]|nr:hypothetical protein [Hyphomicrobiaceae bacterium]
MPLLHIGDHTHIALVDLVSHLIEPDHIFFAALTLAVGWVAYRHGRRVEVRAQQSKPTPTDRSS